MMDNQLPKLQEIGVTPMCFFKKKKREERKQLSLPENFVLTKVCTPKLNMSHKHLQHKHHTCNRVKTKPSQFGIIFLTNQQQSLA